MLDRLNIERGIENTMQGVWQFQLSVYVTQAEAAWKAANGQGSALALSRQARAEILRLSRLAKENALPALRREIARLVAEDMDQQLALYRRAYQAGIMASAPVVPAAVTAAQVAAMLGLSDFLERTIDRIASYAGQEAAKVVENVLGDKLAGGRTTDQLAKEAAKLIREQGIQIKLPATDKRGPRTIHDVYAYVRQNIVTATAYSSGERQRELFESMDMPEDKKGVETSSHWGARPEHALWQGKVFKSWQAFVDATNYGEITGICGINCRHLFYPFIFGLSEQGFFPKDSAENDRRYQEQQWRRRKESEARKLEAADAVNKALELPEKHTARIKALRKVLRDHKKAQEAIAREYKEAA